MNVIILNTIIKYLKKLASGDCDEFSLDFVGVVNNDVVLPVKFLKKIMI
jgi:hypothetical protein